MGECAFLGKPVIALVIAENQRRTVEHLAKRGAAIHSTAEDAGRWVDQLLRDPDQRASLSTAIGGLVDGLGADRVVDSLLDEPLPA